jgi:hypothetical protein
MAKKRTKETCLVEKVLAEHFPDSPRKYPPQAYRYSPVSIIIRVVSPQFEGLNPSQRIDLTSQALSTLSDKTLGDIWLMYMFTPDEVANSMANFVFENPPPRQRLPPLVKQRKRKV